jgi:hypothetical protein
MACTTTLLLWKCKELRCSVNAHWGDQELGGDMKREKIPRRERCAYGRGMEEAYHRITEPGRNINRSKHNYLKTILHYRNLYQFYLKYNKTTTIFYILCLVPAFVGPHQRSSSFWWVMKNLEWDPWAGHSRNNFFSSQICILYEFDNWLCN